VPVQVDMNAYATPVVKRLSVVIAAAAVVVVAAIVAVHPSATAASLPVPTTASAPTTPATQTSTTTAAASGRTGAATTGPGPTTGDAPVMALQQRLAALGYDVGAADGRIGERTTASVMAF
jgi:hypothetical protein